MIWMLLRQPKHLHLDPTTRPRFTPPPKPTPKKRRGISERIGPYKTLQPIGEGGIGQVFMVDQQEPIKRRVALKLINTDTPGAKILARFEAERQALAMMDHQHIAKVLAAGVTDDGKPYFAMELDTVGNTTTKRLTTSRT
jgi:serine/threonine protein kinase